MVLSHRNLTILMLLVGLFAFAASIIARDESRDPVQAVQGKWVRHQATANGQIKLVKEHKGQNTVLTAYDDKGNVIYAHNSEFKVEQLGKVHIFTFFNRTIMAGPNAGEQFKEPVSFVYRIAENRFIEVHGLLDGETADPLMIIWDRDQNDTEGKGAAAETPPSGVVPAGR